MDYNETACNIWIKEDWFDEWCTGINQYEIPQGNSFGEDENGNGFTLKEACKETCDQSKFRLGHRVFKSFM